MRTNTKELLAATAAKSRVLFRILSRTKRRALRLAPQFAGGLIAVFLAASVYTYFGVYTPPERFPIKTIITVPEGSSVQDVAHILHEAHVIRSPISFVATVRFSADDANVLAGDYYFDRPLTLTEVATRMMRGTFGLTPITVTIPEGMTSYQMAELLENKYERFDPQLFNLLVEDKEGYLFPDTYSFPPNIETREIVETLEKTFYARISPLEEDIATFGRPIHEIITMASLLEKEAYDSDERRTIAGILYKRLEIGMPLQVDAVFGYIARRETFSPRYSDLEVESPYNTYKNTELPPGPIGSPSLDSIMAAVQPEDTDALFYLHGRDGTLHVADTYDEHLINKRRYLD